MRIENLFNLKGKTALVTGGSQGIGKAISLALAEQGANLVINYRSCSDLAGSAANEIKEMGVKCWLLECDLSRINSAKTISKFLRVNNLEIDILVLCASIQIRKSWDEVTAKEFELQTNTNLRASLFLIQEMFPIMAKKKWGRIVTIGSVQQKRPHKQMIVYAATKVAQVSMVKNLAPQFAPFGVNINNLAPGVIETGRNKLALADKNYKALVESKIPAGYIGEITDCVSLALLLCSDASRYITGQDMFIDGGMSLNV